MVRSGELYAYFLPYPPDCLRGSNEQHKAIRAALAERDAASAAALLRDHVAELHHSMYVGLADSAERGEDGCPEAVRVCGRLHLWPTPQIAW